MKTRGANFRLLVTGGLFASLFLALLLSVAPQSHTNIHQDAATGHHECAVTLIATGKCQQNTAPILVSLPRPAVQWGKIPSLHPVWVPAPFLGARIFEHAPPALS
jgi:hypothetical protein